MSNPSAKGGKHTAGRITVNSMVSSRTEEPFVTVYLAGPDAAQLTPAQAREVAGHLIEAAEAAEQDAFIIAFGRQKLGLDLAGAAALLSEYRAWREELLSEYRAWREEQGR